MATNLSDVGFSGPTGSDLEALARKTFQNGKATRCQDGTYIVWSLGQGIELWIQLSRSEELLALNPHFSGKTRLSAGLTHAITRNGLPMDGGYVAFAQPYGGEEIQGAFRFVFDTPDFLVHKEEKLPRIASVQLTAFAQQCVFVPAEADFKSLLARHPMRPAPDVLVPLGFTGPDRRPLAEPLASAMLCGQIFDAQKLINPLTKAAFWSLRLRNAAGEMDVVADPELLPRGAVVGGYLQCTAWLSGRLV